MAQTISISVGRLIGRNEKLTTAKFNAVVKSITIAMSGIVDTDSLEDGAVTPAKARTGAWFYEAALLDGNTYAADYAPAITSYEDGLWLAFKADSDCPANANFDAGPGQKPLYKYGGRFALDAGDIQAGSIVEVRYNAALVVGGCWEVMSLVGPKPGSEQAVYNQQNFY